MAHLALNSLNHCTRPVGGPSDTAEIGLTDVRVPVTNRLGEEGSGFGTVMQTFVGERLFLAFWVTKQHISFCKTHLNTRENGKVFGRRLSAFN